MQTPGKSRHREWYFGSSQFAQAMKEHMHEDHVCVEAVDSRGENQIEMQIVDCLIPEAGNHIQNQPQEKPEKVRARNRRNFVPDDTSLLGSLGGRPPGREILDALG